MHYLQNRRRVKKDRHAADWRFVPAVLVSRFTGGAGNGNGAVGKAGRVVAL